MAETLPGAATAAAPAHKLDDLMLAMDVVDTLRHQESVATRELDESGRAEALVERLRSIYREQGLEVPDRIIREGVKALRESRFVYTPPPRGRARTLALIWVHRARWRRAALAVVGVLAIFLVGRELLVEGPARRAAEAQRIELSETLPRAIERVATEARAEAQADSARQQAERIAADARAALSRKDVAAARKGLGDLEDLNARLRQTYELRIIPRRGQPVGVFRVPDRNRAARNHYLIVDAIGPDGKPVAVPIVSEETSERRVVSRWGVRVPEATWQAVGRDRNDDGIIQRNRVGEKRRGRLDVDYLMPVVGGAILEW
jgi:hypothetical protein